MEIDYNTFLKCIGDIQKVSDDLHDGWTLSPGENRYLHNKTRKNFEGTIITIEYHVLYDFTYMVPKLCFNIFREDGSLVSTDECAKILHFNSPNVLEAFSQMDHPTLRIPFYCLHPCRTPEFLNTVHSSTKNIVVTWLSAVGAKVGLYLDNEYAKLTQ